MMVQSASHNLKFWMAADVTTVTHRFPVEAGMTSSHMPHYRGDVFTTHRNTAVMEEVSRLLFLVQYLMTVTCR